MKRSPADFYRTPPECTHALLHAERVPQRVWEPACGDGAIAKILEATGRQVVSTDLHDRGFGNASVDFLRETEAPFAALVTNPPFSLAEPFIRHAWLLDIEYMALLLKATYWHAAARSGLFDAWPPAVVYAMTWRPDFDGRGAPTMDCCWVVWDDARRQGETRYRLMRKPA